MFLFCSKPTEIFQPGSLIELWQSLGVLDEWVAQIKRNGSRAITWTGSSLKMMTRDGTTLTPSREVDWNFLKEIFGEDSLIDGELVGRKQGETSNHLYLWDIPVYQGKSLTHLCYAERYEILEDVLTSSKLDRAATLQNNTPLDTSYTSAHYGIRFQMTVDSLAKVSLADCFDPVKWIDVARFMKEEHRRTENSGGCELEGIVFKNRTSDMAWSKTKTKEIREQVKLLVKHWNPNV